MTIWVRSASPDGPREVWLGQWVPRKEFQSLQGERVSYGGRPVPVSETRITIAVIARKERLWCRPTKASQRLH